MTKTSPKMDAYFETITKKVMKAYEAASIARSQGLDPEDKVEVALAENMAQRVVGLISVVAPQIVKCGVEERIMELEAKYGALDWRVALIIAKEIAEEKFCKFSDKKTAMEIGIRTGFAYSTVGVVSSPLDGLMNIDFKKRRDNRGEYMIVNFAGPIRNAGGTNAALCVIIADYVRKSQGYDVYDPDEMERRRTHVEILDYHERCSPRQYIPSAEETEFMMSNLPVEIGAEPSEDMEVSTCKDLPRVETNKIRSGFCLLMTDCLPLKAPKLWKQLGKWGAEVGMEHWNFLDEYLKLQKKNKSKGEVKKEDVKTVSPDYTFIKDVLSGRPILSYPLASGGLRLRYGRCRMSGYSSQSIHPATMAVLNEYIATGTQLKVERPGKATTISTCSTIDGPIVKTKDGSVYRVNTLEEAKKLSPEIEEIIYLGDVLICYGDFFNRAHPLVPAGYCEEWWIQEVQKALADKNINLDDVLPKERLNQFISNHLTPISIHEAITISSKLSVPLHPKFTYFWREIGLQQLKDLILWMEDGVMHPANNGVKIVLPLSAAKRSLELLGVPHLAVNKEFVVISEEHGQALLSVLNFKQIDSVKKALEGCNEKNALKALKLVSPIVMQDKSGTFVGARMGRPEKAKQRELTGSPHALFPVGEEGGRMRSINTAITAGKIKAQTAIFKCKKCSRETISGMCEICYERTTRMWKCLLCGLIETPECEKHGKAIPVQEHTIQIKNYLDKWLSYAGIRQYPELIKGVRGTSNREHFVEHILKGVLRAGNKIHVYKDGTTRYDMSEMALTAFKPFEIGTTVEKLKSLGYTTDIKGKPLVEDTQIVEIFPQDIILPAFDSPEYEGASTVLMNTAKFVDELMVKMYKLEPFYNIKTQSDLIGEIVIALAPHTSAGTVCRIIGFSKTQGFLAHPLVHAATRRDCDGDESCVLLLMDAFLNFSKKYLPANRGSTMDTPLVLTTILVPSEVDDMVFDLDIADKYPLELYHGALDFKMPWDVPIRQLKKFLNTVEQYETHYFTHDTDDINNTIRMSAYKTAPSMEEKLRGQMDISEKVRAVDASDVATLVIEKHLIRDIKGNLRKFSQQEFRCGSCNEKYRRPPLAGKCTNCPTGKIIFTISEGSIVKYVEPAVSLAKKYNVSPYLQQTLELLQQRIEGVFGREKEKQAGLGAWFG